MSIIPPLFPITHRLFSNLFSSPEENVFTITIVSCKIWEEGEGRGKKGRFFHFFKTRIRVALRRSFTKYPTTVRRIRIIKRNGASGAEEARLTIIIIYALVYRCAKIVMSSQPAANKVSTGEVRKRFRFRRDTQLTRSGGGEKGKECDKRSSHAASNADKKWLIRFSPSIVRIYPTGFEESTITGLLPPRH